MIISLTDPGAALAPLQTRSKNARVCVRVYKYNAPEITRSSTLPVTPAPTGKWTFCSKRDDASFLVKFACYMWEGYTTAHRTRVTHMRHARLEAGRVRQNVVSKRRS